MRSLIFLAVLLCLLTGIPANAADAPGETLFLQHCASCHGSDRLGLSGPALLPGNLRRLKKPRAAQAITNGLPASQMPAFAEILTTEQVGSLVDFIYTPPAQQPRWEAEQVRASHRILNPDLLEPGAARLEPVYRADLLNLFLVVEAGDWTLRLFRLPRWLDHQVRHVPAGESRRGTRRHQHP